MKINKDNFCLKLSRIFCNGKSRLNPLLWQRIWAMWKPETFTWSQLSPCSHSLWHLVQLESGLLLGQPYQSCFLTHQITKATSASKLNGHNLQIVCLQCNSCSVSAYWYDLNWWGFLLLKLTSNSISLRFLRYIIHAAAPAGDNFSEGTSVLVQDLYILFQIDWITHQIIADVIMVMFPFYSASNKNRSFSCTPVIAL